jgi:hypothetical protein
MRHTLLRALTLTALLGPGAAQAVDPEHVAALVQGGATQLALRLVESQQKADMPFDDWVRWESQRLSVLKALRRWSDLAHRVDALPSTAPAAFRRAAIEAAAEARLAANDPAGARRYLRQLLWQEQVSGEDAARTRRLIIRSYLQQGLLEDAQTALLLYQRDYQARSEPWLVLHAEILVQAGKARAAANALAGLQSFEARLLRLLAGLRGKVQSPREVLVAEQAGRHAVGASRTATRGVDRGGGGRDRRRRWRRANHRARARLVAAGERRLVAVSSQRRRFVACL